MISKNRIKYIQSLQDKKAREKEKLYIIEGEKLVKGYLNSGIRLNFLAALPEFINLLSPIEKATIDEIEPASMKDLERMSALKTPHNAIAAVSFPAGLPDPLKITDNLLIALESVQDPGNLGTIIRAAAWFGFRYIICSLNCADVYNPKVIQASMGALLNVTVLYYDLKQLLEEARKRELPVYGTYLEGESVYNLKLGNRGIILFGNESMGISDDLFPLITTRLMIPKITTSIHGVESLNVGMAASVVFSEFARRMS
ncbi:MAG TPA: RNA methyltransferase [Bacteroidales bacterium]|nr:RNA methyltransferase [Bacteroidales bacterium]HBZ19593.1 RNA methyltransferase [Bacteroidales bacterium]